MLRSRFALPVLLAFPGLTLAVVGLFHPHHLTYDTSERWWTLHVPGLLVFPLVGLALARLVHERHDPPAWVVRLAAYVFATFYSALDVISGIGAGYVTHELGRGAARPEAVSLMFRIGTDLGRVGEYALLTCVVVLVVDQVVRHGGRAVPAVLLVPGAWLVHVGHIFAPQGVAGMVLIGLATGWLAWVRAAQRVTPSNRTTRREDATEPG